MPQDKIEQTALRITRWVGSPQSIALHTLVFIASFLAVVFGYVVFDKMLLILTTIVSLEAIYLAIFIQMTINYTTKTIEAVSHDIDEIQEDVAEMQEDVEEIQEDMGEIQEDVEEIAEDVEEIQGDVDELQEDVGEIAEDVDELQEDVEEMSEEDKVEEAREVADGKTLEQIHEGLQKLMKDIERLQSK